MIEQLVEKTTKLGVTLYLISYPSTGHYIVHIKKGKLDSNLNGPSLEALAQTQLEVLATWNLKREEPKTVKEEDDLDFLD